MPFFPLFVRKDDNKSTRKFDTKTMTDDDISDSEATTDTEATTPREDKNAIIYIQYILVCTANAGQPMPIPHFEPFSH